MRKQFFNSFKLYKTPQPFRYLQQSLKQNPKMAWNIGSATLFASFFTLVGKSFHDKAQNSTQNPSAQQSSISPNQVQFEPFNDEKYQDALKNKFDAVVFINPENWADHLVDEVNAVLSGLQNYQVMTKGRKIKFFALQVETKEQAKEFADKYGSKINRDTLFFLKNRFSESFKEFNLEDWFDNQRSLYAYFKKLQKLTPENFDKFAGSLAHLDSDMKVLLTYIPKKTQDYKKHIREAGKLAMNFATSSGGDITSFAVTDPEIAAKLGLEAKDEGKVLMMTKSSKYNNYNKTANIGGVNLLILQTPIEIGAPLEKAKTVLSDFYKDNFTFMKSDFDQLNVKYSLVLQVNENKIKKHELNQCIDTFNEAHKELKASHPDLFKDFKIVKYKANLHDKAYRVYVQNDKDRTDDLYLKYYNKKPLTTEQREKLLKQSSKTFVFDFPDEQPLNKLTLIQFLKDVKDNKVSEHFGSGKPVTIQKYSNKVVQDTYKKEILDVDKDHAVFLCTKHCPGCKFMGKFFEEFALENAKKPDPKVQYNRINSEKNTLEYLPNYPYTPVFVVLKKEEKLKPFVYKAQYALPDLLKDFIDITVSSTLIGRDVEKKIFDSYLANRKLFEGMKLEEIK